MASLNLEALLEKKRIIVCCGSGGVGKTTVSAVLGVHSALRGKKVLTLTIDPAKRLANSLGLTALGNTETLVPEEKFRQYGRPLKGSLYAMMLDTKHTFDELIKRYAPNETIAENILDNQFYKNLSSAMAGSHEYLAMEKLYQIYLRGRYDLIILDTPPTKHALDFLEAPSRVRSFFDHSTSQWFLKPYLSMGQVGLNLFNKTSTTIFRMVEKVTGAEFLRDVSEFMTGLADAFDIFRSRAEEVMEVLRGEATSFLLVTGPEKTALDEAHYFYTRIKEASLPFGGIIVNRVNLKPLKEAMETDAPQWLHQAVDPDEDPIISHLKEKRGLSPSMTGELIENFNRFVDLAQKDETILANFMKIFAEELQVMTIPVFDEDIFDLDGLLKINDLLFPP